jgi:hypothetical protein
LSFTQAVVVHGSARKRTLASLLRCALRLANVASTHSIETPPETHSRPAARTLGQALWLALILALPVLVCAHAAGVFDTDVWWHLASGQWILAHHAVPHTDPFTIYAAGKPWIAYSWLFESLLAALFARFGTAGLLLYACTMVLAVTVAVWKLVTREAHRFVDAALLTLATMLSFWHLDAPRPWHLSMFCFVLLLLAIDEARSRGNVRVLVALPLLFALWASLHIQFIDGLLVLGLAVIESLHRAMRSGPATAHTHPGNHTPASAFTPRLALLTFAVCCLAPAANPYGWHIYAEAWRLATQVGVANSIQELQALPFRRSADFLALALVLLAVGSLARARHVRLFDCLLLLFAILVGFRSQRDVWILAICSAHVIAAYALPRARGACVQHSSQPGRWITAAATLLLIFFGVRLMQLNNTKLNALVAQRLPVQAAAFVTRNDLQGPLYNDFPWGGYLIFALHQPVAIDGRAALHGTPRLEEFAATWGGRPSWQTDPELARANLVLGPVDAPLTQLLRLDPRFRLVYVDGLAAIFIRQTPCAARSQPCLR